MIEGLIAKGKGFLLEPAESFRKSRGDSVGAAYRYFVVLLIVYTILSAIIAVAAGMYAFNTMVVQLGQAGMVGEVLSGALAHMGSFVAAMILFAVYLFFLMALFGIFIKGLALHIFVLLFGGKKGPEQTLKTAMYATTPFFLLGWIPYVSIIGVIWYLVLMVIGIREMQEIELGKALLVVFVPIVLMLIMVILGGIVIAGLIQGFLNMIPLLA
jgi:hypothetical protein